MPRIARIKVKGDAVVYHVMSRTALDAFVLGDPALERASRVGEIIIMPI